MKIPQKARIVGLALAASATLALASTQIVPDGRWPATWPKELESFRSRSKTLRVAMGNHEDVYEIPFESRKEFEAAWPHILSLRSKGSPIILQAGPTRYSSIPPTIKAGVLILGPCSSNTGPVLPDGTLLRSGPPWPDSIQYPSGDLPGYVVAANGRWVPYTTNMQTNILIGFHYRARVDVMLIVDGDIVDTNRITFPEGVKLVPGHFRVQQSHD
jgi:hypothetical protein